LGRYNFDLRVRTSPQKIIQSRVNRIRREVGFMKTNITDFDMVVGGVPYGLTSIYGPAGSGKSMIARAIAEQALHDGKKVMYVISEVAIDAPSRKKYPNNLYVVDYTKYLPKPKETLTQLMSVIEVIEPDLVIIDSFSLLFSGTTAAMPESEIRSVVAELYKMVHGVLPVVGVHMVHGNYRDQILGGTSNEHLCDVLIEMRGEIVKTSEYGSPYGVGANEMLYTFLVKKNKFGQSTPIRYRVVYSEDYLLGVWPEGDIFSFRRPEMNVD